MGLSNSQRFLIKANASTGAGEYFRWQQVGDALGYSGAETDQAVRSLADRKLLIRLLEGNARILDAGRALATRLGSKPSRS